MAEIRSCDDGQPKFSFAGDTYNTAVYAQREMGIENGIAYVTRIGCDPLSRAFMLRAGGEGIDVSHVRTDTERNIGIYSVSTDGQGERRFHYWRSESSARQMFAKDATTPELPPARLIYLSGITLAILTPAARTRLIDTLMLKRSQEGTLVAFDSNYRPILWENRVVANDTMDRMWEITDIALPSIDDEKALTRETEGAVIDRFAKRSWKGVAIKRGSRGPLSPALATREHPAFDPAARVVDTTAAGDSFNGAYLAAFLLGADERECLIAGHKLGVRVVGFSGAVIWSSNMI